MAAGQMTKIKKLKGFAAGRARFAGGQCPAEEKTDGSKSVRCGEAWRPSEVAGASANETLGH
jgi:hypothetical protein